MDNKCSKEIAQSDALQHSHDPHILQILKDQLTVTVSINKREGTQKQSDNEYEYGPFKNFF